MSTVGIRHEKIIKTLWMILIGSLIILIWLISFYLAMRGAAALPEIKGRTVDLTTAMSGTMTIALAILSLILAVASMYGLSSLERKIKDVAEEETRKRLEKVEKESRGRAYAILGYIMGESSVSSDFSVPINEEHFKEAITYCQDGYDYLKGTGAPVEFMALNNLLGYYCVAKDNSKRGYILERARHLKAAAQEHRSSNLLLTYIKVIYHYSLESEERAAADSLLKDISLDPNLSEKQKREAGQLASLFKQPKT